MENTLKNKIYRIVSNTKINKPEDNMKISYNILLQNHFRKTLVVSSIIALNWIVLRRAFLPQFGYLIHGRIRNMSLDLLPSIFYINFQLVFKIVYYENIIKYLDKDGIVYDQLDKKIKRDSELLKIKKEKEKEYFFNSQYWH